MPFLSGGIRGPQGPAGPTGPSGSNSLAAFDGSPLNALLWRNRNSQVVRERISTGIDKEFTNFGPLPNAFLDDAIDIEFYRDFAGLKTLDHGAGPGITFTRNSGATFFDANGVLQTAANGVPRFDHDPANGNSLGLLVESNRTNLLLNSAALATQTVTVTAAEHTLSFYGTGEVVLSGAHSATLTGSGAFPTRATLTFTPSAGSLTATVTGTVEYAQLEVGPFATSYIPTTGASATRAAESANVTSISSFYNQIEGTLFAEARAINSSDTSPLRFDDGTAQNSAFIFRTGSGRAGFNVRVSSVDQFNATTGLNTWPDLQFARVAMAYALDDFAGSLDGAAALTDSTGTVPSGLNRMLIGQSNTIRLNGTVAKIAYWPKRLPDAMLEQLTT
jgi:hypothetical protein